MEQAKTERERGFKTNRGWLMLGALEESELMKSLERKFTSKKKGCKNKEEKTFFLYKRGQF